MRVVILTEGNKNIGFGHLTRCISFYELFEGLRARPELIIDGDKSIVHLLKDKRFQLFNWRKKRHRLNNILCGDNNILVIDSYLANLSVYKRLVKFAKIPVFIDDNNRLEYPSGIVINGSIDAERIGYVKGDGITHLLGIRFAPLRKEFWRVPRKLIRQDIREVMVTFGGDDIKNMTPKILNFFKEKFPFYIKNIVIGKGFKNLKIIRKMKDEMTNIIYYPDGKAMKEVMLKSDLAISAGGQTLYELARVGLPTIGICVIKNQELNLLGWHRHGFTEYIGWYSDKDILFKLRSSIEKMRDYQERLKRSRAGTANIDGKGLVRIFDFLKKAYENNHWDRRGKW